MENTNFISLNCHGIKANFKYIDFLSSTYDIIFLSETWITETEKILLHNFQKDFYIFFEPAKQGLTGRPYGGTAMMIKRTLPSPELLSKTDFNTTVKIPLKNYDLLIIGVYLQSVNNNPNVRDIYSSQLSNIGGTIKQFENSSECIILGDFQSCPTTHPSGRMGKPNSLTDHLNEFIRTFNLTPIDITNGTGPSYTYHHATLPNQSYIDHILVSNNILNRITNINILQQHYLNTSDHLPIVCNMKTDFSPSLFNHGINDPNAIPNYLWKNDIFVNNFKETVSKHLYRSKNSNITEEITHLHNTLNNCAIETYNKLKLSDFHFIKTKPWWNTELTKKRKILQRCFNDWRDRNFTREPSDISFNRYLLARKDFRSSSKRYKNQATTDHFINVEKIKTFKPRSYWKQIQLHNSKDDKLYTINNKSDVNDINQEFSSHFDNLLNTPRTDNINNTISNKKLHELLADLEKNKTSDFYVSATDVEEAIMSLNRNKTSDPFNIKAEHFIHSISPNMLSYITPLINDILNTTDLPPALSTSIIIPIMKSSKKPIQDPNNYRGISLIPILTKIMEKLIINKCPSLKNHKNSQFGFTSDASTVHAELLIRDTISYYNAKNTPVYICSLDAEKAFDCCNWLLLFEKLKSKNLLPETVLKFLIKLYVNGEAATRYRSNTSHPFHLSQGVRQGSLLSPYLYNIYTEDLIDIVQDLNLGTYLPGNINTSIIVFADDIILLSPTLSQLQKMVDTCTDFGFQNGLKFNISKTQFLISGKSPIEHPKLSLNHKEIHTKSQLKHLGFNWQMFKDKLSLRYHQNSRISELWATTASLTSCGIRKMHPATIATIFRSIVVPKVLYGIEITDCTNSFIENISRQCRSALKHLLNLSKHSSNDLIKYFNLDSISNEITNRQINLVQQLMRNPSTTKYLLTLLNTPYDLRSVSILQNIFDTCTQNNVDIMDIIITKNKHNKLKTSSTLTTDKQNELHHLLSNWHIYENRLLLKQILESNIPRT